jgi:hypothetical protein
MRDIEMHCPADLWPSHQLARRLRKQERIEMMPEKVVKKRLFYEETKQGVGAICNVG